jgi:hypothetical protein
MISRKNIGAATVFLLSILLGCDDHERPAPICSCKANLKTDFNSIPGIFVNTLDGFVFLSPYAGYYEICHEIDSYLQVDGLMATVTGKLKATCVKPDDELETIDLSFVNLEDWSISQDSLFDEMPVRIKIIRSEDYGYPEGFGYDVQTLNGGFHIRQLIIPAIEGIVPFKTRTDAFKTAVLVAYKLNVDMGLPTLTVQDLRYLKVLE